MALIRNIVLLAAGRGSRMGTETTHKALLPIQGVPAIQRMIEQIMTFDIDQMVIVLGHAADEMESFITHHCPSDKIKTIRNKLYAEDTNILSTDIGVDALDDPTAGYLIVETDIVLESSAWERILTSSAERSFWVTRGSYAPNLTGGALKTDCGQVSDLVYAPNYNKKYNGYKKLLGMMHISSKDVGVDRSIRKKSIKNGISQYYMTPWIKNINSVNFAMLDITDLLGFSYNNVTSYIGARDIMEASAKK